MGRGVKVLVGVGVIEGVQVGVKVAVNDAVNDGVNDGVNTNVFVGGTTELVNVGVATTGVFVAETGVKQLVGIGCDPTMIKVLALSNPLPLSKIVSVTV